jgi:predicted house-cleaning NTP pyrophosphatase (Maf/HAM1 superfamily)
VNKPLLILASNSPRRRELLALGGWMFHTRPADVDESQRSGEAPGDYVLRLAESKARACAESAHPDLVIVAADTAVVIGKAIPDTAFPKSEMRGKQPLTPALRAGKKENWGVWGGGFTPPQLPKPRFGESPAILGKPKDMAEAVEMLKALRGHAHQVYTGIAILRFSPGIPGGELVTDLCITDVPMRAYRDDEIEAYVATGDPLDKAGAYAIQNAVFHPVEAMQGCYASVMGLPLCHLSRSLHKLEITPNSDIAEACQSALGYACPISAAVLRGEMVG